MIATHILVGHDGSRDAEAVEDALDLAAPGARSALRRLSSESRSPRPGSKPRQRLKWRLATTNACSRVCGARHRSEI